MVTLKNRYGQAIVEFALALPLLLFFLLSFIYMSLVLHDYLAMSELTREIARQESVGKDYKTIKTHLKIEDRFTHLYSLNPEEGKGVVITKESEDPKLGKYVTVRLTINLNEDWGVPIMVTSILPNTLNAELTMRQEG